MNLINMPVDVDGAVAAAGPGRRHSRIDRRVSDPGRVAGCAARQLSGSPTTACRRSARRSSRANAIIKDNPEVVKKFIAASLKGWSFALDNPDKAVKDLKAVFPEINEKLAAAELAAITPLFCSGGAKYIGKAEDALWAKTPGPAVARSSCCPPARTRRAYYTNDYLPPTSAMRACKS